MATQSDRSVPILGVILIIVGLLLFLDRLDIIHIGFLNIVFVAMILYGLVLVIRSFSGADRNRVFWGTTLFLGGIYFLLNSMDVIRHRDEIFIPAILMIFGFSFLMSYIYRPRDWHLLIPTLFFLGISAVMFGEYLSYFRSVDVGYYLATYWPILLILLGLGLIANVKSRKKAASGQN